MSDSEHRYVLRRGQSLWPEDKGTVMFIMLNPSTATAERDDPTIRKCKGFASLWGYQKLVVTNLSPRRATKPKDLLQGPMDSDQVVAQNIQTIRDLQPEVDLVVVAWGAHGVHGRMWPRKWKILTLLQDFDKPVKCLGRTKAGEPKHPLMVAYVTELEDFDWSGLV